MRAKGCLVVQDTVSDNPGLNHIRWCLSFDGLKHLVPSNFNLTEDEGLLDTQGPKSSENLCG